MKTKPVYLSIAFAAIGLLPSPSWAMHKLPDSHIKGWVLSGNDPNNYQSGIDRNVKHSGAASAFLTSINRARYDKGCMLMQVIKSDPYKGKRIRLTAWIKTGDGVSGLWLETNRIENSELPGGGVRFIYKNTDWKKCKLVVDVDSASPYIEFGVILIDTGKVWIDEVAIETVADSVPLSSSFYRKIGAVSNLSFEKYALASNTPDYWANDVSIGYELTSDHSVFHDGTASACVKSVDNTGKHQYNYGHISGRMMPDSFAGKRVRMTGWIKTENINKWAGLWMRVDGPNYGEVLSFDNMEKRAIKGTTDWTKCEIVLDVPKLATAIYFGALFEGKGKLWLDEVKFEVVGNDVPITNKYSTKGKRYKSNIKLKLQCMNPTIVNPDFEG